MRILTILLLLLCAATAGAQERDSIVVSLLTCAPGAEVYELCGHEAIRVRSAGARQMGAAELSAAVGRQQEEPLDSVWNYGTFDFEQPNFIYRFVKGETDYMVSSYPMRYFLYEYQAQRRNVVEQDLNLTQDEAWRLLGMLRENALPENRTYRYNYVKDNCATRIIDMVDSAASAPVIYPDSVNFGTFRREMRAFHKDYPWYQYGIDLCLGSGIDYRLRGREEMFVPVVMRHRVAAARLADGRPLVSATRTLNKGVADATLGPTHPLLTPLAVSWAFFVLALVVAWLQWRKRPAPPRTAGEILLRLFYSLWFGLTGLAGCLVTFLVFVSTHEATTPNLLLLWLNPLQLVIAVGVWFGRTWRVPTVAMAFVDVLVLSLMLIVWPMQPQSANPAVFPQVGATLALALSYAIKRTNISYYKNEEVGNLGAGGSGHARKRGTSRQRTSASGGRNRR